MASPAELAQILPDTLPEDFNEWDGENLPAAQPDDGSSFNCSNGSGAVSKPVVQSEKLQIVDPQIAAMPKVEEWRYEPSSLSPAVYPDHDTLQEGLRAIGAVWKTKAISASQDKAPASETNEALFTPVRSSGVLEDGQRNVPSLSSSACGDEEDLGGSLRALGAALNSEPISTSHEQEDACETNDVAFQPVQTSDAAVNELRSEPPPAPSKASTEDEDFFNQLRTIGSVLNGQPIRSSNKSAPYRAKDEVSFKASQQPVPSRAKDEMSFEASRQPALARATDESSSKASHKPMPVRETEDDSFKPAGADGPVKRFWPTEPIHVSAAVGVTDGLGAPMFRSDLDDLGDESFARKNWMKFAAIGVAAILLLILGVRLMSHGKSALAKQSVAVQPEVTEEVPAGTTRKPSPSTPLDGGRLLVATGLQPMPGDQPGGSGKNNPSSQVNSQLMNDQLTAPQRIPQDIKAKVKEETPPSEGFSPVSAVDASDASSIGVFKEQARPTVGYAPAALVIIPAAVADGLLVQRTKPVYPPGAWYSGTTGKVVLQATVSRTGSVENVLFISGPHIFRQAALDAVKSWHYKPYMVENEAREFQTTVDVNFDQTGGGNPLSILHFGSRSKKTTTGLQSAGAGAL